ncbi:MAG: 2-phosphosulfolactate phosphatase [Verrucomicrobiales bacterium]
MFPKIHIEQGIYGAARARGVAVVIDVFRAFTTACHAAAAGARPLLPADSPESAMTLLKKFPDAMTAGERYGRPLPGFDFGNSPALLEESKFRLAGRPFIQATHAGTRGLLAATGAEEVLAASLVNAAATARYLRAIRAEVVTLVPMGWTGEEPAEEDDLCADYIAARLRGENPSTTGFATRLRSAVAAEKFFDPDQPWAPEEDFHLCLRVNRFPFALRLDRQPHARLTPIAMA